MIAGGNFERRRTSIQKLRGLGIPVLVLYAPDVKTVFSDIDAPWARRSAGRTRPPRSSTQMQAAFKGVTDAVAGAPRPRVYYEIDATGAFYGPAGQVVPRRDDLARRR